MENIGIIGQGFVGTAIRERFKNFYNVYTYDKFKEEDSCKWTKDSNTRIFTMEDVLDNCDIVFVCLPTPMNKDGSCYIGIVEDVVSQINDYNEGGENSKTVVIKSTVPPGTSRAFDKYLYDNIDVVFNPEFLTEANAIEDFANQTRIILGGPRPATTILKTIYSKVFPKATIVKTDSTHAEMVKYVTNCFLATKVSFANEMYQLCGSLDIDYDKVIEYAQYDERLGTSHWTVPGPDGSMGFSGSCFPKDYNALIHMAKEMGVDVPTMKGAWEKNLEVRPQKDWEDLKGRAVVDK